FRRAMTAGGYYLHKRQWRPMGRARREAMMTPHARDQNGAEGARRAPGRDADGDPVGACGDTGRDAAEALIAAFTEDPRRREGIRRDYARRVRELAGESPTAV